MTAISRKIRPADNREFTGPADSTLKEILLDIPGAAYYGKSADTLNLSYDSGPKAAVPLYMKRGSAKIPESAEAVRSVTDAFLIRKLQEDHYL